MSNDKAVQVRFANGSLNSFDTVQEALSHAKEQTSKSVNGEVCKISFSLGKERIILDHMTQDNGQSLWCLRDHPMFLNPG